ncbi:serine/threonine-protein kinase [Nocardiopsis ansamitocini]|uniref:non-specific serine/threonine protein kinase n=1 Tax=Nocardiopsis ansamitocini TaxID=1670832 RepID=A0A9W6P2D8_9ACTN|nr:serine/threonine-protein kinase [Nocardiopsis ansamitocini]GLU45846.1 protein kinase [Nocardiopsis ansamitocini]
MAERVLDGRYRLTEKLGTGGMGEVWRALDERLHRPVAVKLVRPDLVDAPDAIARFRREARMTAQLTGHPNIVVLYDYGTDSGTVYAVMELVEGRPMLAALGQGPVPVALAARWGAQVCAGLSVAHDAGIVHRDVKPGNLMVVDSDDQDGGTIKVLDFGVAGFAALHSRRLNRAGDLAGTPLYMSPEQIQSLPVGAPGDLYSFGAVLYQLLTGFPPFQAREPLPVLRMHLTEDPTPPDALRQDLPPSLSELVLQLLAKEPAQRPASAEAVRERLLAFTGAPGAPLDAPARPTGARGPVGPRQRRRGLERNLDEAQALADAGSFNDAVRLLEPLLDEAAQVYGVEHPQTLRARRRHAHLTGEAGAPERAAALLEELVRALDRVHGRDHPETRTARYHLAANTGRAGRRAAAARIRQELLDDLVAAYGPSSNKVLINRLYQAFDVGESGEHGQAATLLAALVPDMSRVMGAYSPDTLTARHYLAAYTGLAGRPVEAVRLYRDLLADHIRMHGPDHPQTARIKARLARWERPGR